MHPARRARTSRSSIVRRADAVYQTTCAPCHTSQLSFADGAVEPAAATFREGGINCEMCHGPSLDHVERMKSGAKAAHRGGDPRSVFDGCQPSDTWRCARSATRSRPCTTRSAGGAVNHSEAGEPFRTYSHRASFGLFTQGVLSRRPLPRDDVHQRSICALGVFSQGRAPRADRATIPIRRMPRRIRTR